MKFIGNYKNWIDDNILEIILSTDGDQRPGKELSLKSQQQYNDAKSSSYSEGAKWSFYYEEHLGITNFILPFSTEKRYKWWFVKIDPGCVFPLHVDTFEEESNKIKRIWIPCQDYLTGHIFIYNDNLIKDYQAYDIFEFNDPNALHGSANLTSTPKISLQITIYE
jgi:hypothetical protein